MKNTLLIITLVTLLASCGSKSNSNTAANGATTDTTGLAAFQASKSEQLQPIEMQGIPANNLLAAQTPVEAPAEPKVVYRDRPAKTRTVVKYVKPDVSNDIPATYGGNTRDAVYRDTNTGTGSNTSTSTSTGVETGSGSGVGTQPVATSTPETPAKKGGWSNAAKGAVIGGASGAVLGAIVSKNKAKGAIIGGVVGAAGGYLFGKSKDKKQPSVVANYD